MWMILDVIIAAIFVIFAVMGAKRGFIKSILGIGVVIAAIVITMNFYTYLADYFRSTLVYAQLTEKLNEKIEDYVSNTMDEDKMMELFDEAPAGISALFAGFGVSTEEVGEKYSEMISSGEENVAASISDYIVEPAARTLSNALAVLVMFIAAVIVLNLVIMLLDLIFRLPILKTFNKIGGLFVGLVLGLLVCFVFCAAVKLAIPYLPGAGIDITAENLENTLLFSEISNMNPLAFLYE